MGAWMQIRTLDDFRLGVAALYELFLGLNNTLYVTMLSEGYNAAYAQKFEQVQPIYAAARIDPILHDMLWNDQNYGWRNFSSLETWIQAYLEYPAMDTASILMRYFGLTRMHIHDLFQGGSFNDQMLVLIQSIRNYYQCPDTDCEFGVIPSHFISNR
jgi:hypothetical protein